MDLFKNTGDKSLSEIAIKNSVYNLAFVIIGKIGGLILTIILARMLLPELFGIYSLALSIVIIAFTFTDFGAEITGIRYMSKALEKSDVKKARSYFRYLLLIKISLIFMVILTLSLIAKNISEEFFGKHLLFLPIMASILYILVEPLRSFFSMPFVAKKSMKILPYSETIFQVTRIILCIFAAYILSYELKVSGIFVALAVSGFLSLSFISFFLIKHNRNLIFGDSIKINKKKIFTYMMYVGLTGVTLTFFGSIDTLMLGRFVDAPYIGYYRAALGLILSLSALLPFSGVLLPIFTQIHGKRLERGFEKSLRYLMMLSIPMAVGLIFMAKYIIVLIYGQEYLVATSSLFILSFLIIISPTIALYSTLFQAKEKPKILAKFIFISLIMNIFLNYILIKMLLTVSQEYAIIGAGAATLLSNIFYMGVLIIKTHSNFRLKINLFPIIKAIISTGVMALFLSVFRVYININILTGMIMIILGACVYFSTMIILKGVTREDMNILKFLLDKKIN